VRVLFAMAALSAVAAAGAAQAQEPAPSLSSPQIYGTLGYLKKEDSNLDAVQLRLGARLAPHFGVEGEFANGVEPHTVNFPSVPPIQIKDQLRYQFAAYGVGYLPITPQAELFARVGYGQTWTKRTFAIPPNLAVVKGDAGSFNYGVGGQYSFDGKNGVRVDYTREDYKHGTEDTWGVSYVRKF